MTDYELLCKEAFAEGCESLKIYDDDLLPKFTDVCQYLFKYPERLSWKSRTKPSLFEKDVLIQLAQKYISGYNHSNFPKEPTTIPDEMVSIIMNIVFSHSVEKCEKIKIEHRQSMAAENCVGALLERYINSVVKDHGWSWCCGNFVKAIDFIYKYNDDWYSLQIKNRDNTENSSSRAIRGNTNIQYWFRTFSRKEGTNWDNMPELMGKYGLSEDGFIEFVSTYLTNELKKNAKDQ